MYKSQEKGQPPLQARLKVRGWKQGPGDPAGSGVAEVRFVRGESLGPRTAPARGVCSLRTAGCPEGRRPESEC